MTMSKAACGPTRRMISSPELVSRKTNVTSGILLPSTSSSPIITPLNVETSILRISKFSRLVISRPSVGEWGTRRHARRRGGCRLFRRRDQ